MSSDSEDELQCAGCRKHYSKKVELNLHVSQCQKYADYFKSFGASLVATQAATMTSFRKRRRTQPHSPSSDSDSTGSSMSGRSHDIPAASSGDEQATAQAAGNDDTDSDSASDSGRKGSQTALDDDNGDDHLYAMSDIQQDERPLPYIEHTRQADETVHADRDNSGTPANVSESDSEMSDTSSIHRPHGICAPWRRGIITLPAQTPLQDELPVGPSGDLESDVEDDVEPGEPMDVEPSGLRLRIALKVKTAINRFGIWRVYGRRPTAVPDLNLPSNQLNNPKLPLRRPRKILDIIWPFPNVSALLFGHWRSTGSNQKSDGECKKLQEIITSPLFNPGDIAGVDFAAMDKLLAQSDSSSGAENGLWHGSGWKTSSVSISVPRGQKQTKAAKRLLKEQERRQERRRRLGGSDDEDDNGGIMDTLEFVVNNVHTRSLTNIAETWLTDPTAKDYHWHAFDEFWKPPGDRPTERVYTDICNSPAFVATEKEVLSGPPEPGCDLPRAVLAMMGWSDSTHLAQFGDAKLWPFYFLPGNHTKYVRCQPSARCAAHGAFAPSLGPEFDDFLLKHGINATPQLKAHCRRELFHAVWRLLLDDEFLHAYEHGIVVDCGDGIRRRVYPRFFTYSADYPEKVLIATIRDMGNCPCPQCTMPKDKIRNMGSKTDQRMRLVMVRKDDDERRSKVEKARSLIYENGYAVNGERVEDLLKSESLVPTVNAFSACLGNFLAVFLLLVVDLMHEFELGVWKAVLIHIIRILNTLKDNQLQVFNERFRQISSFGRDTIRRFGHNVSELKKLAARDYEDILQCIIPCLQGLLPNAADEEFLMDLLYVMSYWHSLAKLRMHTDSSVNELDQATKALGNCLRHFSDVVCSHYQTYETDKELGARQRRQAAKAAKQNSKSTTGTGGRRKRTFNLETYKLHALGYYVPTIRRLGPTDAYSTQLGELEHRRVKQRYARTNKRNFVAQIVKMDSVERALHQVEKELDELIHYNPEEEDTPMDSVDTDMQNRYHIAKEESSKNILFLRPWLRHSIDPALQGFERRLRCHILTRLDGIVDVGDEAEYTDEELSALTIDRDAIYSHATASFNYTTYDVRRDQDTINTNTGRRDILLRSHEAMRHGVHPYWYARVMGIYHCNVRYHGERQRRRIDFLFVRWFGQDTEWIGGPQTLRLNKVGFVPDGDESGAFGFLDPSQVLRACHFIPVFAEGKTTALLDARSKYRDSAEGDWASYYVMRFADRDMMMRFFGIAIGHKNPDNFPVECGTLKREVLQDNTTVPWEDLGREGESSESDSEEEEPRATASIDEDSDDDSDDGSEDDDIVQFDY